MAKPQATHGVTSGHEAKDIRFKWVIVVITLALIAAVVIFAAVWLFQKAAAPATLQSTVPAEEWTSAPPPRLQISARRDLAEYLAREQAELNSYGWIDRTAGVVRIPIERAMELIAERGLPVRAQQSGGKTPLELLQERRDREAERKEGR